jgi:electron transfer flavoprotein beta subunit
MNILVCIKRVPATGSKINLTPDAQAIDTQYLGFTISPHEECAVEEAVRLVEAHGGSSTALTLGPDLASEQLRDALALGLDDAILLETDGREFDPQATAAAIAAAIQARHAAAPLDLVLFGNESADSGGYQVGIRVAHALGWPVVTGVKGLQVEGRTLTATREGPGGREVFEIALPAVVGVKEGLNLPRYPSLPGRLKAKKKPLARQPAPARDPGLHMLRLKLPPASTHQVEILGQGAAAAPQVVALFERLGLL